MGIKIDYKQCGDYLIPDLRMTPIGRLGKYGTLRKDYLMEEKHPIFIDLWANEKLFSHLQEVNLEAMKMEENLIQWISEQEGVTEELKKQNMLRWVQLMNNIKSRAEEIVISELIRV